MFQQTQLLLKVTQVKSTLFRQGSPISHWPVSKRGPPYSRRGGLYRVFIVGGSKLFAIDFCKKYYIINE